MSQRRSKRQSKKEVFQKISRGEEARRNESKPRFLTMMREYWNAPLLYGLFAVGWCLERMKLSVRRFKRVLQDDSMILFLFVYHIFAVLIMLFATRFYLSYGKQSEEDCRRHGLCNLLLLHYRQELEIFFVVTIHLAFTCALSCFRGGRGYITIVFETIRIVFDCFFLYLFKINPPYAEKNDN